MKGELCTLGIPESLNVLLHELKVGAEHQFNNELMCQYANVPIKGTLAVTFAIICFLIGTLALANRHDVS